LVVHNLGQVLGGEKRPFAPFEGAWWFLLVAATEGQRRACEGGTVSLARASFLRRVGRCIFHDAEGSLCTRFLRGSFFLDLGALLPRCMECPLDTFRQHKQANLFLGSDHYDRIKTTMENRHTAKRSQTHETIEVTCFRTEHG